MYEHTGGWLESGRSLSGDKMGSSEFHGVLLGLVIIIILRLTERVLKVSYHPEAGNSNP